MHSHLWEMCEVLKQAGIGITILTTGLLLRRDASRLVQYCDDVVVSLDGPPAVHDRIRNLPGAFDRLAAGVRAVKEADPAVSVSGRCTVQKENFRFLREIVTDAMGLDLDRISFLAADVHSEAFNRPETWDQDRASEVALQIEDLPDLEAELEALEREHGAEFENGYISESPEKLRRRLLQYFRATHGLADFHPNVCNAPWVSTVIESDGTVRPCFFHAPIGNIRESCGLDAALNSPKAVEFRRNLNVQTNPVCRRCVCTLALRRSEE